MKWFKHDTNAHNDEKIREMIHEVGCEGYGVYVIVLELVGEKIDENLSPQISISDRVLREKCRLSHQKLVKILSFLDQKMLIFSKLIGKNWEISCPNMLNRLDNWTKKQSSNYVATTSQVPSNQNQKENQNKKKEEEPELPRDGFFNEKEEQMLLKDISKARNVAEKSEAAKLRLKEIIHEILMTKKPVGSALALARHKAINQ